MTPSTSSVSKRRAAGTDCSRHSRISQWTYICFSRRSASGRVAAMMTMLSTRWPERVLTLKPYRVMALASLVPRFPSTAGLGRGDSGTCAA